MDPAVSLARRPNRPTRGDLALAGALVAWALLDAIVVEGPGPTWARIGFALAISVPLAFRRQAPLALVIWIAAASILRALTVDEPEMGTMPFPCILLAVFSVALYARTDLGAIAGGLIAASTIGVILSTDFYEGEPSPGNYLIIFFFTSGAWTAGWLIRRRAAQLAAERASSGERAREAVAAERARIARELHDVVAHSVSIVSVQAGAAEQLVGRDDDGARRHLRTVRRTAHEALVEMRRLLDVLRAEEAEWSPQPNLDRIDELIAEARAAGIPVDLSIRGQSAELPAGVDLAAFRIVQEALTNVRKHAAGAATRVEIEYQPRELRILIANARGRVAPAASRNGGGHGLVGMRERARLYGGSVTAGPVAAGGFEVVATLPLEEPGA